MRKSDTSPSCQLEEPFLNTRWYRHQSESLPLSLSPMNRHDIGVGRIVSLLLSPPQRTNLASWITRDPFIAADDRNCGGMEVATVSVPRSAPARRQGQARLERDEWNRRREKIASLRPSGATRQSSRFEVMKVKRPLKIGGKLSLLSARVIRYP